MYLSRIRLCLGTAAKAAVALAAVCALMAPARAQDAFHIGATGSPPGLVELPMYLARDRNFFKDEGLEIKFSAFTGDPIALRALIAGDVDVVNTNLSTTISGVASGAQIKAVASQVTKLTYLFIARKGISSLKELEGKTIAVSAPGALSYHVPRMVMEKHGADPDKAQYLAVGSDTQRFQAIAAKRADASILHVIRAIEARNNPEFVSLADVGKELPDLVQFYLTVSDKTVRERPDQIRRFLRAHIKAIRWMLDNKAEAVKYAMTMIPNVTEQTVSQGYDLIVQSGAWDSNMAVDDKAVAATHDLIVRTKVIAAPVAAERFIDKKFIDLALKEMGRR